MAKLFAGEFRGISPFRFPITQQKGYGRRRGISMHSMPRGDQTNSRHDARLIVITITHIPFA